MFSKSRIVVRKLSPNGPSIRRIITCMWEVWEEIFLWFSVKHKKLWQEIVKQKKVKLLACGSIIL